jgi:hypothetical protein
MMNLLIISTQNEVYHYLKKTRVCKKDLFNEFEFYLQRLNLNQFDFYIDQHEELGFSKQRDIIIEYLSNAH